MLPTSLIEDTYEKLSDKEVRQLATQDPKNLTGEAAQILIAEIKKRKIGDRLVERIINARNFFDETEQAGLIARVKKEVCPRCGLTHARISGHIIMTVDDVFEKTGEQIPKIIACHKCGKSMKVKATMHSISFGLFHAGSLFKIPIYLLNNLFRAIKRNSESKTVFKEFIFENTARLRQSEKNNFKNLPDILKSYNKRQMKDSEVKY